jgi:nucleotide-binding universal stress UspA family protein
MAPGMRAKVCFTILFQTDDKECSMKILLAVDGSKFTKKMLAYLAAHEGWLDEGRHDYTVFTAVPALPPRARAAVGKDIAESYYHDEAEKVLAPVSKFLERHGVYARSSYKVGHAGELIAKESQAQKIDLLIMGSHGHGALMNLVMGSVATQVLAQSKVPVMIVR